MNKVLVLSDSHGLTNELTAIKERHQLDQMIHCGDSELYFDSPELKGFLTVAGNCDFDRRFKNELIFTIGGLKFFITHGHLHTVNSNLLKLAYKAEELEADVVCYGHTHRVHVEKTNNQLFINPGSIRSPRGYSKKTYVIIDWETTDKVAIQFYTLAGTIIPELSYEASFT